MSKDLTISVDDRLYEKLQKQFNEFGIEMNEGIKFVLENFVDDTNNIFEQEKPKKVVRTYQNVDLDDRVTKTIAKNLFQSNNCLIYGNYTYASRGREGTSSSEIYWANPKFEFLKEDWTIILNDKRISKLYLINIPKNTFEEKDFVSRSDKYLIDMKIRCDDNQYRDMTSRTPLKEYLIASIDYKDLQKPTFTKLQ